MDAITAIIKPCSALCNISCVYCYHNWLQPKINKKSMSIEALEKVIEELANLQQKTIRIIWHGGEPLLIGERFFKAVLEMQAKHPKRFINLIQTNGTLITPSWAEIFKEGGFSVGISIDGSQLINDLFRQKKNGEGTFVNIMQGIKILQEKGIEVGALSVITKQSAGKAKQIFNFLYKSRLLKMNFSPCIEDTQEYSISDIEWANFLLKIFNLWLEKDNPCVKIIPLESFVQGLIGGRPTVCYYKRDCTNFLSIDYDGTVYVCGRTLGIKEFQIGNVLNQNLEDMLENEKFKRIRKDVITLPQNCISCEWLKVCNGGCPLQRIETKGMKQYYFCKTMKIILPEMKKIIQEFVP